MARGGFKKERIKCDGTTFVRLPNVVLDSPGYRAASHPARSLLVDIARQFNGKNNGKLVACSKYLRPLGWKSSQTVAAAMQQLLELGLLVETRKGGFPNTASWFALAWRDLDHWQDLDINPKLFQRGSYMQPPPKAATTRSTANATEARRQAALARRQAKDGAALVPMNGAKAPAITPRDGTKPATPAPLDGAIGPTARPSPTPLDGEYLETPSAAVASPSAGAKSSVSPSLRAAMARTAAGIAP